LQLERLEDLESKRENRFSKLIGSFKTMTMNPKRVHLLIGGRVQGVYFRQGLKETAEKNNVLGWVQNLSNNKVESVLEGNDSNVDAVIEWAHFGPAGAFVEELKITEENYIGKFSEFEIRY